MGGVHFRTFAACVVSRFPFVSCVNFLKGQTWRVIGVIPLFNFFHPRPYSGRIPLSP